ncbi:choice-of-anchor B family protein [uncultured Flavobacterium sp.]|uniref:choice-of-anchor B family protein n=1 Tax=uncultured Flavobacterium sp. TaxID=165435 RepID=UPI0030EBE6D7|tara:strand:- start:28316 stop:29734 length:1419 start_codon:yes stop_codon:yes gene_type:complete
MKRKYLFNLIFIYSAIVFAQTPCSSGMAGIYPCNNIDLMSNMTKTQLGGLLNAEFNDIWGWTDPLNNNEYAIIGLTSHTAFVNITNPISPIYLGKLPTATSNSTWRDIKVYNNHAFIVSEASNHGMQVFDLTRLRNVTSPQTFTSDAHYTGFGKCHNIAINEATGYAYAIGSTTFSGGPHFVNIQNPVMPVAAGGYSAQDYSHDAHIVIYNGPDTQHVGKEIFFGANEDKVVVVDVTNKATPILLSTFSYSNTSYTHQGWLTDDHKYFLAGDELDESNFGFNTKTLIIDMTDLDAPVLKSNYFGVTPAIDHNGYTKGNDFYLANYRAGLRLLDISSINAGTMNEIGFFDTYPTSNSNSFNGAWSVYPYFASGNIIISDIERGLFVVRKSAALSNENFEKQSFSMHPNPSKYLTTITSNEIITSVEVFNTIGQNIKSYKNINSNDFEINTSEFTTGLYMVVVNKTISKKLIIE